MNNILTFEDYRKMNIRQVESVIYRQFIEEDIKEEDVNEGFIRKAINKAAGKFIQTALAEEIEKGKELEKSIKDALDGLNAGFDDIKKKISKKDDSKSKLAAIEKVKEAIKAVQSQTFDTLTMIGSEGEIDFSGFVGSATVSAAVNFGILFSPIRSLFITRKAYKYFLGIIKQTIRRNLLVIQLNFDQFENLILQKSFENEDTEANAKRDAIRDTITELTIQLCDPKSSLKVIKGESNIKKMKEFLQSIKSAQDLNKNLEKSNPYNSLWQDQHNNTYTRTLEQIKQYINDDSQKELDALKNSITKMAGNDTELAQYGELLISAAEEYAIHTNHGINNNFIKMSSVFNLENQKKLIELITTAQNENEEEIKKKKQQQEKRKERSETKKKIKEGKKLYEDNEKTLKSPDYTYEQFEKDFGDKIDCLRAYLKGDDEGKTKYEELLKINHLYKYYIGDIKDLNNILTSIKDNLKVFKVEKMDDEFYKETELDKSQTFYYMMAERSIKNAINSETKNVDDYFGFNIDSKNVDNTTHTLTSSDVVKNNKINSIIKTKNTTDSKGKTISTIIPKYFLYLNGSGDKLFDILHKDFKTEIFNKDKTYIDDISIERKKEILKLINKNCNNKIDSNISIEQFAKYLVRLEAHMLLTKQKKWFVVKDNTELKDCFEPDTDKVLNKNAFVEINEDDYKEIKTFIDKIALLEKNDFDLNVLTENEKNKKDE